MGGGITQSNLQNSGRRRFSKRGGNRLMSEINVTPFVDVNACSSNNIYGSCTFAYCRN